MVPDGSRVLCIWVVIVLVLAGQRIVGSPSIKRSTVVLAVDVDRCICGAEIVDAHNSLWTISLVSYRDHKKKSYLGLCAS